MSSDNECPSSSPEISPTESSASTFSSLSDPIAPLQQHVFLEDETSKRSSSSREQPMHSNISSADLDENAVILDWVDEQSSDNTGPDGKLFGMGIVSCCTG